jgi:hypothetical protein
MSRRGGRSETRPPVHPEGERRTVRERAASSLALLSPVLFAAAFVLDRFAVTNSAVEELPRPMAFLIAVAVLLTLILWVVLRNRYWASVVASTIFLILVVHPIPAMVMIALVAWWVGIGIIRRAQGRRSHGLGPGDLPVQIASVYSVVLVLFGMWSSAGAVTGGIAARPGLPTSTSGEAGGGGPDIYLLLLDGYPRGDTLGAELGFDNSSFESELAQLGFAVAREARANYNKTWLTVASMLNARYVQAIPEIADPPAAAPAQVRLAHAVINEAAVLDRLRELGYAVVSIPSPVMTSDVTEDADVRTTGHLNSFEIALASASLPAFLVPDVVLDALSSDARGNVLDQLALVSEYAIGPGPAPRVLLAHLMSPHPPFLLCQEPDYLRDCFPACKLWETTVEEMGVTDQEYARRMRIQVAALNQKVVETVRHIATENPTAIVILMSDHGARLHEASVDEHFRTFFAARTPGFDGLFADDQSPVNVFRRILSAAYGDDLADLPYEAWESNWRLPLVIHAHP